MALMAMVLTALLSDAVIPSEGVETPRATPEWRWLATEHIGALTGTALNPTRGVGITGTDLGVSFEVGGRLAFLFGDSWTLDKADWDADSVALAAFERPARWKLPRLEWSKREDGRFLPLAPRGIRLGGMDVPVEGLAVGSRTYVFFDGGWDKGRKRHSHSLLARTSGTDFGALELVHTVASERFLNLSIVVEGDVAWIFGTGAYRKSAVYLARVPVAQIEDRKAWRYWPGFGAGEESAGALVASEAIGELSVRRLPAAGGLWVLAYNDDQAGGVSLRTAPAAVGPWSEPLLIFDLHRDDERRRILHRSAAVSGFDDGLSDPGREEVTGGPYGPYLVPSWCEAPAAGVLEIAYTLSSWNPYRVHLMRTWLVREGVSWTPPRRLATEGVAGPAPGDLGFPKGSLEGWRAEGDAFECARRVDGAWEVCTYVKPKGDAVRGRLWREFVVPADATEIRFHVHGGSEAVRLWRGDDLVRETSGRRTNDRETPARWSVEDFRGEKVRLEIADDSTAKWGFVTVRGIELTR